ncbi:FdtA/QdtA family cupin domain-containing protein [Bacteroidia bacterium]|nr:FdtA/QdtA family cupin domain-containing protein [Bacteroidia bacterium]
MENIKLISLPKILDPRGNLTFLQHPDQVPFEIKRVFWIYDVPGGETRGGHAYKTQCELIVALSGSFDVVVNDGKQEQRFHLNRSYTGLYIPAKVWRHMENFATNSLSLHLSDSVYNADDYLWDKNNFFDI